MNKAIFITNQINPDDMSKYWNTDKALATRKKRLLKFLGDMK